MVEVGIRELKSDLSALLKRAAAGEPIRVTNHGKPFVDLVAAAPAGQKGIEEIFNELAAAGVITRARNPTGRRLPSRKYDFTSSPTDSITEERHRERNQR